MEEISLPATRQLLGPQTIRQLSDHLGVQPTKKLGQNFLHDGGTVRRIVAASGVKSEEVVLEVGPGLGSLTLGLLDAGAYVTAIEIDPPLARQLPLTVAQMRPDLAPNLHVHLSDALDLGAWQQLGTPWQEPRRLIANLPYNVAVPILLHCLALYPSLRSALVMVQAEVADRLVATPGQKSYGVPSVKAAWYGPSKRAGAIGRTVFWPAPNVDSALVDLQISDTPRGTDELRNTTFRIIDAAFAQRRKMLRAALRSWIGSAEETTVLLEEAGIDGTRRAETLTVDEFQLLGEAAVRVDPVRAPLLTKILSAQESRYA